MTGTSDPRRPSARRVAWLKRGVAVLALAELFVLVVVAKAIGVGWLFLLLFASAVAGIVTMRQAGRGALEQLRAGQVEDDVLVVDERGQLLPTTAPRPVAQRALLAAGGVLLLVPGLISSALGALMWITPVRRGVGARLRTLVMARVEKVMPPQAPTSAQPRVEVIDVKRAGSPTQTQAPHPERKALDPAPQDRVE